MALHKVKDMIKWMQRKRPSERYTRLLDELNNDAQRYIEFYTLTESSSWHRKCTRDEAERLLCDMPMGTFMIRPNSTGDLALSLIVNNIIYHIIIIKTVDGYCLKGIDHHFPTLSHFVVYYSTHSLDEHKLCVRAKLVYPINLLLGNTGPK